MSQTNNTLDIKETLEHSALYLLGKLVDVMPIDMLFFEDKTFSQLIGAERYNKDFIHSVGEGWRTGLESMPAQYHQIHMLYTFITEILGRVIHAESLERLRECSEALEIAECAWKDCAETVARAGKAASDATAARSHGKTKAGLTEIEGRCNMDLRSCLDFNKQSCR
jgi:hypothetical protein